MSLLMIDLAYLGTKTIFHVGYYLVKGTYNTVAYLTGHEMIEEKDEDKTDNQALLDEIKNLRNEMDGLRKEIKTINDDTYMLVNSEQSEPRIIATICDNTDLKVKNEEQDTDKQITL